MSENLIGKEVFLNISEPWDLGEQLQWAEKTGVVIAFNKDDQLLLLQLNDPFTYRGERCMFFIAKPRHNDQNFEKIASESVCSSLTKVSDAQANSDSPFDLSMWRGGIALLGDLFIKV